MDDCASREQSLADWPKKNLFPDLQNIAKAGYYYKRNALQPNSDVLYCAFCNLRLGQWDVNDNPYVEHAKHSPTCIHLLTIKGRQWIEEHRQWRNDLGGDGNGLRPLIMPDECSFRNQSIVVTHNVGEYTTPQGYRYRPPVFNAFTEYEARKRSILRALRKQRKIISPRKWARAGFFSVPGPLLELKCYYCTLSVSQFDTDDDPDVIHAKLRKWCFHLIAEYGERRVDYISCEENRSPIEEENINTHDQNGRCRHCRRPRSVSDFVCCIRCKCMVCSDNQRCLQYCCCN